MGFDIDINIELDEDDFRETVADTAEEAFREWIETEVRDGHIECDCGSTSFDTETWYNGNNELQGAAVCRDCNERINLDIDTSEIDDLR